MAKSKKKTGRKHRDVMGRSDIPYAQRIKMTKEATIAHERDHTAKIVLWCHCLALHELECAGYKRLVRFAQSCKSAITDFYEDVHVGMAHAKRRLGLMGMEISGELYNLADIEMTLKDPDRLMHKLHAAQIATLCCVISMNDEFKLGRSRQEKVSRRVTELTERYAKEGEGFLLEAMAKIGFPIVDGTVVAYADESGKAVMPSRARKEGWAQDG